MLFSENRAELRRMYADAWQKARAQAFLSPLEAQIAGVVKDHPEYHKALADERVDADFLPESGQTNPFLHMGLHLAVRDQVKLDRPPGIRTLHAALLAQAGDAHTAEHGMIDCLAEALWEAQSRNALPDEQRYLERVRQLLR